LAPIWSNSNPKLYLQHEKLTSLPLSRHFANLTSGMRTIQNFERAVERRQRQRKQLFEMFRSVPLYLVLNLFILVSKGARSCWPFDNPKGFPVLEKISPERWGKGKFLTRSSKQCQGQISLQFHKKSFWSFLCVTLINFIWSNILNWTPFVRILPCASVGDQKHRLPLKMMTSSYEDLVPHGRVWPTRPLMG